MVHLSEGTGEAPRICAMSKMENEPQVLVLKECGVRLFEVGCSWGLESNGEG